MITRLCTKFGNYILIYISILLFNTIVKLSFSKDRKSGDHRIIRTITIIYLAHLLLASQWIIRTSIPGGLAFWWLICIIREQAELRISAGRNAKRRDFRANEDDSRFFLIGHIIGPGRVLVPETIPGESDRGIQSQTANGFGVRVSLSKSSGMLKKIAN